MFFSRLRTPGCVRPERSGFTLIELTGVLVILALVAAMVIPIVAGSGGTISVDIGNGKKSAEAVVTESTMQAIRDTFVSTTTGTGLWADLGHIPDRLPRFLEQLFDSTAPTTGTSTPVFNPVTKIGWRGPYLTQPTGTYPDVTSELGARGFTSAYGTADAPALIDAWGSPVVLQIDLDSDGIITPVEAAAARLVSAGPNGVIEWEITDILTQQEYLTAYQSGLLDDIVLYLGITQ